MSSPLNNRNIFGVGFNTTAALDPDTSAPWIAATIQTFPDRVYQVLAKILAVETEDHDEAASYILVGVFLNDGGTLSQVGSTTDVSTIESTGGWAVAFDVDGDEIQIIVTGAASTNIAWLIDAEIKNLGGYSANGSVLGEQS